MVAVSSALNMTPYPGIYPFQGKAINPFFIAMAFVSIQHFVVVEHNERKSLREEGNEQKYNFLSFVAKVVFFHFCVCVRFVLFLSATVFRFHSISPNRKGSIFFRVR